jgi:hypothetical protein
MKPFNELKVGDKIDVTYENGVSVTETITKIEKGEDCFHGSGRWYMYLGTENENYEGEIFNKEEPYPQHWPIVIKLNLDKCEYVVDIAYRQEAKIRTR